MKIAIAGTGWGARVQVPAFRAAGFEVTGIAGRDRERTGTIASRLDVPAFASWQELLERSGAEWISIVTPPSEHREMALAALRGGMHVLCEKPTAMNSGEAEEMLGAASRAKSQYALIDHELRFLPTWIEARRRVESLGDLRFVEIRYSSPSRGDVNRPWNWWSDADRGGGIWGAVGSHMIDAVRYLAGEVDAVSAHLATTIATRHDEHGNQRPVTSDDTTVATLRLESGVMAQITLSVTASVDEHTTITIHGSGGGLRLRDHSLEAAERAGEWTRIAVTPERESAGNSKGGPFGTGTHLLAEAIVSAMRGNASALDPAARFEDGLMQQRVLDAGRESSRTGGAWVAVQRR